MTIAAAELLESNSSLDLPTRGILRVVAALDNLGAREWDLRMVGVYTCAFLGMVRMTLGKKNNVAWYALIHNIVTGVGAVMAVYLDFFASETLTGTAEPLRSCLCGGPLTSVHRIVPAITMGYGILDFLEGLNWGVDYAAHGVVTFFIMTFFVESGLPQVVVPYLLMEVSSIFLSFMRADFLTESMSVIVQMIFAVNFFFFRIIVSPFMWYRLVNMMNEHKDEELYQSCFNPYVLPASFFVGLFFHFLNAYWFYKIVRKVRRHYSKQQKKGKAHTDRKTDTKNATRLSAITEEDKENIRTKANSAANDRANGKKTR